jgi:AraC-like DNA-binding protein
MHLEIKIGEACKNIICTFPNGICMINIIYSEDLPEFIFNDNTKIKLRSFLSGLLTKAVKIGNTGTFRCIMTYLTPLGAYHLFEIPQSEYINKFIPPEWFARGWDNMVEEVCLQGSCTDKIRIMEKFFKARLLISNEKPDKYDAIANYINCSKGRIKLDDLTHKFNITPRTLDRNFFTISGLPPKPYANLIRLEVAYKMLLFQKQLNIHDIVYLLGYYDQSHLTREFASYADISPAELKTNSNSVLFPKILTPEQ